ncbi:MAG: flagellar protein FlaG [Thalassotalea sp.]
MSVKIIKDSPIQLVDDFSSLNKKTPRDNGSEEQLKKAHKNAAISELSTDKSNKTAEVAFQQMEVAEKENKSQDELNAESELISDAMKTISEFINMPVRTVNFTHDDGSEKTVIKIYDSQSNELIKQFPSEEILMIAQRIVELQQDISQKTGILLDESI